MSIKCKNKLNAHLCALISAQNLTTILTRATFLIICRPPLNVNNTNYTGTKVIRHLTSGQKGTEEVQLVPILAVDSY